jgi:hypothetical protein
VKDLSHLPRAQEVEGLAPDADTTFVTVLVDELAKQPPKPKAADTLSRHSSAASCLKRVALLRDGVEPEPFDLASLHMARIGTLMHEDWQGAVQRRWPDAELEPPSTLGDLTSGSSDTLLRGYLPGEDRVIELKSTAITSYEYLIGLKGPATGPKTTHMVQLALNVVGHDAGSGVLVYFGRSAVSAGKAESKGLSEALRIGAQWTFTREQLQPLADEWLAQLEWVRDHPTDEVPRFVPHEMPKGARLNPETGAWTQEVNGDIVDTGSYWSKGAGCLHYCSVSEACRKAYAEGK